MTAQFSVSVTGPTGKHNFDSGVYQLYISGPCTVSFTPATMPSGPLQHFMIFICLALCENVTFSQMSQNAEQALLSPAIDPPAPDQPENAGENL